MRTVPGYATDIITDLALDWISSLPASQPYCVLIYRKAPHRPWVPPPFSENRFIEPIPLPPTFGDDYATRSSSARRAAMRIAEHLTLEDLKTPPAPGSRTSRRRSGSTSGSIEDYLRCVASVDDNVGRVTGFPRERGEFDDTVLRPRVVRQTLHVRAVAADAAGGPRARAQAGATGRFDYVRTYAAN